MKTPRDRRQSQPLDLYPDLRACPVCHRILRERYHKQRWIIRLDRQMKVVSHFLECENWGCPQRAIVYRPHQEDALALRGYTFGLDVVARIGELRYHKHPYVSTEAGGPGHRGPALLDSGTAACAPRPPQGHRKNRT